MNDKIDRKTKRHIRGLTQMVDELREQCEQKEEKIRKLREQRDKVIEHCKVIAALAWYEHKLLGPAGPTPMDDVFLDHQGAMARLVKE